MPMSPPADSSDSASPPEPAAPAGRWMTWVVVGCTAAVFWPVTRWMIAETAARQQVRQAFILLAAATALVAWSHRREMRLVGEIGNRAIVLLGAAFGLTGIAALTGWSLLVLPALTLALAGSLQALFGASSYRFFRPLVAGVTAFVVIILLFPLLDWPLRQLAGVGAAQVLNAVNIVPQLTQVTNDAGPQLLLTVGPQTFLVATECNGFGLITSGGLLALLASGICNRRWPIVAALIPIGMLIGFVMNIVRILVISLSAPYFPDHYYEMHEVVGTLALWLGLGLVGWLSWRPRSEVAP